MSGGAGREAQVDRELPIGRGVREPVHPLVVRELVEARPARADAGDLRMARHRRELLGVQQDPRAVGRVLAAVGRARIGGDRPVVGAVDPDRADRDVRPRLGAAPVEAHIGQARAVGAHAVEEVHDALLVRDPLRGAAAEQDAPDVEVVRRGEDGLAVGREDVVVVDGRETGGIQRRRRAGTVGGQGPQQAVGVDEQAAIGRPVGRLEQAVLGDVDGARRTCRAVPDADACDLALGQQARGDLEARGRARLGVRSGRRWTRVSAHERSPSTRIGRPDRRTVAMRG